MSCGCKKSHCKTKCHCKKCCKKKYYKKVCTKVPYYKTKCHDYYKGDSSSSCGGGYDSGHGHGGYMGMGYDSSSRY